MPANELRIAAGDEELQIVVGPVPDDAVERLTTAAVTVLGRMRNASNATFLVRLDGADGLAIYKPGRGERPLWDFEPGLYRREVAAYLLSEAAGLGVVPPTVLRPDAPLGEGSLQWFVNADFAEHYFSLYAERPDLHDQLRAIAVFDVIANNTDRKSGHCLLEVESVDAGEAPITCGPSTTACASRPRTSCAPSSGSSPASRLPDACATWRRAWRTPPPALAGLLRDDEIDAVVRRARQLARDGAVPARAPQSRLPVAARVNDDDPLDLLVHRADLDALVRLIDDRTAARDWAGLRAARDRCRAAIATGRQLWPAATLAEYRLALLAPDTWAAPMITEDAGSFTVGPLTEVIAQHHTWAQLHPLLPSTPGSGGRRPRARPAR